MDKKKTRQQNAKVDRSRRNFIKGLGAATGLGLNFFNANLAGAAPGKAPVRLVVVALSHGWGLSPDFDWIKGTENNFSLPQALQPFNRIKNHCTFIDGLRGTFWGNAHDVSYGDILTASVPADTHRRDSHTTSTFSFPNPVGPSIDSFMADRLNTGVMRMSARFTSWGAPYHPICFDSKAKMLPFHTNPASAFDSMIGALTAASGGVNQNQGQNFTDKRNQQYKTLFELLGSDTQKLLAKLGPNERGKLEDYLQSMNALSTKVSVQPRQTTSFEIPTKGGGASTKNEPMIEQYFELAKAGILADTHRISVIGCGDALNDWTWTDPNTGKQHKGMGPHEGNSFHHYIAHHSENASRRACYEGYVRHHAEAVAKFAEDLSKITDVDGRTVLDNTIIMLTGEVGDGRHQNRYKPHIVVGHGGGAITGGKYLKIDRVSPRNRNGMFIGGRDKNGNKYEDTRNYGDDFAVRTHADLFVTICHLMGATDVNQFGFDVYNQGPLDLG